MENSGSTTNPSLPCNYVTITDLRDRWLKQQQQKQSHDEEEPIDTLCTANGGKSRPNVNPSLSREKGFRRSPNSSNGKGCRGEEMSARNRDGNGKELGQEAPEIDDGVGIQQEIGDERTKMGNIMRKKMRRQRKKIQEKEKRIAAKDSIPEVSEIGAKFDAQMVGEDQKKLTCDEKRKLWNERKTMQAKEKRMADKQGDYGVKEDHDSDVSRFGDERKKLTSYERRRLSLQRMREMRMAEKQGQSGLEKDDLNLSENGEFVEIKVGRVRYGVKDLTGEGEAKMNEVTVAVTEKQVADNVVTGTNTLVQEKRLPGTIIDNVVQEKLSSRTETHNVVQEEELSSVTETVNVVQAKRFPVKEALNVVRGKWVPVKVTNKTVQDKRFKVKVTHKTVEEKRVPETETHQMVEENQFQVGEQKMKDVPLLENRDPMMENQYVSKNEEAGGEGEVRRDYQRARVDRKREVTVRGKWGRGGGGGGKRGYHGWTEDRSYGGVGNRDKGVMWVKKGEGLEKTNQCYGVEDGDN